MMKRLLIALLCFPILVQAQDFTLENKAAVSEDSSIGTDLLILPFNSNFFISEVDRKMCPATMDVTTMRSKIRSAVSRQITEAFADSISTMDLSIQGLDEIDIVDYMYNVLDYRYAESKAEEEVKKRFAIGLPKKKEEKVYGAYSVRSEGQLDRREVLHDRYMSAHVANKGAVEYLQDLHPFDHLLIITQLEITRDIYNPEPGGYLCSLHVELLDAEGKSKRGYKEVVVITGPQLEYETFKTETLSNLASAMLKSLWPHFSPIVVASQDNSDY